MRAHFADMRNVAEGAGASPLAALLQENREMDNERLGPVLSDGNVDTAIYRRILAGE